MKKLTVSLNKIFLYLSLISGCFFYANAETVNYFTDSRNISIGSGTRHDESNIVNLSFQYSRPNNFYNFEGRANLEAALNVGSTESDLKKHNVLSGVSQDIIFLYLKDFYSGVGAGVYIENKLSDLLSPNFLFGSQFFVGYEFSQTFRIEGFIKHLSTNSLAKDQSTLNIFGLNFLFNVL